MKEYPGNRITTFYYECPKCNYSTLVCRLCGCNFHGTFGVTDHMFQIHGIYMNMRIMMDGIIFCKQLSSYPPISQLLYLKSEALESYKRKLWNVDSIYDLIEQTRYSGYLCIFCENEYDNFPSKEIALRHISGCIGLRQSLEAKPLYQVPTVS